MTQRRCGEVKRNRKDMRRITKNRQPRRSPHLARFVPTFSALSLTPTFALYMTGPAERNALRERHAAKLAAFSTSVHDDESILSGKRRSFRLIFNRTRTAKSAKRQCDALCDERAAHRPFKNTPQESATKLRGRRGSSSNFACSASARSSRPSRSCARRRRASETSCRRR